MEESQSRRERALAETRSSRLQQPYNQLPECFLHDLNDPEATARYMLQRCIDGQEDYDLMPLLSEWKKVVGSGYKIRCTSFLASSLALICKRDFFMPVAEAVSQGYFRFTPTKDSNYRVTKVTIGGPNQPPLLERIPKIQWCSFTDYSNSGIETPDTRAPSYQSAIFLALASFIGLPFGMYLKTKSVEDHQALKIEFVALQLVRSQTQIPVPLPLDLLSDTETSYLLTTTLPGQRFGSYIDIPSHHDLDIFTHDMQRYLTQLRSISRHGTPKYEISNAIGGPNYDYRIIAAHDYDKERGDFFGPCTDEEDFNNILRTPALPDVFHSTGHNIVFTHSDINMRNVLMHNGRISGIVDWENSGWFPDYWEYTKAHYVIKLNKRWLAVVNRIFESFGDFALDLEIESRLWEYYL
ncbi:hypothetical protein ACKLNR_005188 [Fusarium oxysporum f. sp. zingiberi]